MTFYCQDRNSTVLYDGPFVFIFLSYALKLFIMQDEYFEVDNSAIKHDGFFVNRGKLERM